MQGGNGKRHSRFRNDGVARLKMPVQEQALFLCRNNGKRSLGRGAHIFRIRHGKGHVIPVLLPDVRQRGKEPVKQRGKLLHLLIRRIRIPVNPRGIKKLPVYLTKYLLALVRAQILIENPRIPGLLHNVRLERSCRHFYIGTPILPAHRRTALGIPASLNRMDQLCKRPSCVLIHAGSRILIIILEAPILGSPGRIRRNPALGMIAG